MQLLLRADAGMAQARLSCLSLECSEALLPMITVIRGCHCFGFTFHGFYPVYGRARHHNSEPGVRLCYR